MFATDQYELLDFGGGRKLERFGPHVLDRPAPAAEGAAPRRPELWSQATARYDRQGSSGEWHSARPMDPAWRVQHGPVVLELKLTDFGHLGVFPEQAANWTWIARQVRAVDRPLSVLNLFAYTGAATLAAAAAGAEVAHVDAAANVVAWARRNAALSGLADAPIRWIAEDALKFARRELKRGRRYDAVILDPPSYGHGPRGQAWKLADKLDDLVDVCLQLTAGRREFVLLTCHSGDWAVAAPLLAHFVSQKTAFGDEGKLTAQNMALVSADGQRLHAGAAIRWRRVTDAKSQPPGRERQPIRSRGER